MTQTPNDEPDVPRTAFDTPISETLCEWLFSGDANTNPWIVLTEDFDFDEPTHPVLELSSTILSEGSIVLYHPDDPSEERTIQSDQFVSVVSNR